MKYNPTEWNALIQQLRAAGNRRPWIENCEPLSESPQIRLLFTWGIFNPFGPTISSFALVRPTNRTPWVLYYRMSHPNCRSDVACGLIKSANDTDKIAQLCRPVFAEGTPTGTVLEICPPTFVLQPRPKVLPAQTVASLFKTSLQKSDHANLAADIESFRRFWLDPWKREEGAVEQCLVNMFNPNPPSDSSAQAQAEKFTPAQFSVWWNIVTSPQHVRVELEAVEKAWRQDRARFAEIRCPATWIGEVYGFHVGPLYEPLLRRRTKTSRRDGRHASFGKKGDAETDGGVPRKG